MTDTPDTPAPRPAAEPERPSDPFSLTLGDVHLVSSWLTPRPPGSDAGTSKDVAIGGLSLVFDQTGITLLKPGGGVGAVLPWSSLQDVTVSDTARTPDGDRALMVEATTPERTHRFLVATEDPAELRAVVEEVVTARKQAGRRKSRGRRGVLLIASAVVLAVAIVLAVVLTVA